MAIRNGFGMADGAREREAKQGRAQGRGEREREREHEHEHTFRATSKRAVNVSDQ